MKYEEEEYRHSATIHAETAVLGAAILDEVALNDAMESLKVTDFSLDSHRRIYRAMLEMKEDGEHIDYLTVRNKLERKKELEAIGGPAYIVDLTIGIPRNLNIQSYARIVKDESLRSRAAAVCDLAQTRFWDRSEDARNVIIDLEDQLRKAREEYVEEVTLEAQCAQVIDNIMRERRNEVDVYVPSGVSSFDMTHGGYKTGEVVVIGARPNIGKSTILRQAIRANCKAGNFSHLLSPEMNVDSVVRYLAAREAKVPFRHLRHASRMDANACANVNAAIRDIMNWPLLIDDSKPLFADDLIAKARSVKRKHNTKFLGLDYLQKIKYRGKAEHRHVEISDLMVGLTTLADKERIAVVALSSITEGSEKNRNNPPSKLDLRQSGDIQFEADVVIIMHREIDEKTKTPVPETALIIDKARSDQNGVKYVYFNEDGIFFEDELERFNRLGK